MPIARAAKKSGKQGQSRESTRPNAFLSSIGAESRRWGRDGAEVRCTLSPKLKNFAGQMHGGVIAAVAESAARAALAWRKPDKRCGTVEMKLSYFRPIVNGDLVARARLLPGGDGMPVASVEMFDDGGALAAAAIVTMKVE